MTTLVSQSSFEDRGGNADTTSMHRYNTSSDRVAVALKNNLAFAERVALFPHRASTMLDTIGLSDKKWAEHSLLTMPSGCGGFNKASNMEMEKIPILVFDLINSTTTRPNFAFSFFRRKMMEEWVLLLFDAM
jgi:hypothetical protein